VGRLGGPVVRHVCLLGLYRAFPAVVSLRRVWLWQCAVVGLLVVCNGGALYYIVSKAAVRGYGWQVSFLKIALFEWFSEVVLLRSVEIALFDYGLCWLVGDEVEAAVRQLEAVAAEVTAGSSMVAEDGGVAVEKDAASVSQEMARQWSGLPESRWVAGLRAGRSASHGTVAAAESRIGGSDGRGDRRRRWWTRLLSRGSLETWEMAVSFGCPLVLAWLVFMYYRFVDGWLTSLSALGQGLAAMTVLMSVFATAAVWRLVRRRRPLPVLPSTVDGVLTMPDPVERVSAAVAGVALSVSPPVVLSVTTAAAAVAASAPSLVPLVSTSSNPRLAESASSSSLSSWASTNDTWVFSLNSHDDDSDTAEEIVDGADTAHRVSRSRSDSDSSDALSMSSGSSDNGIRW
jgi:hypothetical protein